MLNLGKNCVIHETAAESERKADPCISCFGLQGVGIEWVITTGLMTCALGVLDDRVRELNMPALPVGTAIALGILLGVSDSWHGGSWGRGVVWVSRGLQAGGELGAWGIQGDSKGEGWGLQGSSRGRTGTQHTSDPQMGDGASREESGSPAPILTP